MSRDHASFLKCCAKAFLASQVRDHGHKGEAHVVPTRFEATRNREIFYISRNSNSTELQMPGRDTAAIMASETLIDKVKRFRAEAYQ